MRMRVGTVECEVVDDGQLAVPPEIIFPAARRAEWPAIETNTDGRLALSVNCLLIRSDRQVILVDTGNGNRPGARFPGGGELLQHLSVAPGEVNVVLLTHPHSDHVGGTTQLRAGRLEPTFPHARHLLARADWDYVTVQRLPVAPHVEQTLIPLHDWGLLDLVGPDLPITDEVTMVSAPGHTPGNSVVRVRSVGEELFFLGDLIHHTAEIENVHLIADGDALPDLVPAARRRVFDQVLATDALVTASHLPFPGLGRLERSDGEVTFRPQ
jgi:glyoxylase-like metal-dependent hydrolase (beta-lactamase superfamily II)